MRQWRPLTTWRLTESSCWVFPEIQSSSSTNGLCLSREIWRWVRITELHTNQNTYCSTKRVGQLASHVKLSQTFLSLAHHIISLTGRAKLAYFKISEFLPIAHQNVKESQGRWLVTRRKYFCSTVSGYEAKEMFHPDMFFDQFCIPRNNKCLLYEVQRWLDLLNSCNHEFGDICRQWQMLLAHQRKSAKQITTHSHGHRRLFAVTFTARSSSVELNWNRHWGYVITRGRRYIKHSIDIISHLSQTFTYLHSIKWSALDCLMAVKT